ncbi:MAG TPA: LPS assembly lipoprotein LptE, partial [Gallionella sp.]|nr:LPS assembly lipoprotein LptE [Gallionella sp.]
LSRLRERVGERETGMENFIIRGGTLGMPGRRMVMRTLVLLMSLLLTACGFHLRGQSAMPFDTLYINASNPGTPFIAELRRNLEANHVKLVNSADKADVTLDIVTEVADKQILSMGGSGRVSEFTLKYHVSLRAYDQQQREWIPADDMTMERNYTFNDAQILAKEAEEALLYQSMRTDMVQQIVRRLSHAKAQPQ